MNLKNLLITMAIVFLAGAGSALAAQGAGAQDRTQDQTRTQDPTTHTGDEPLQTQTQDRDRLYTSTTSTPTPAGSALQNQQQGAAVQNQEQYRLMIEPEHVGPPATTSAALGQMLQVREQELAREAASTTPQDRAAIQNANQVRLAVHALLASQDLLGAGIGPQVADVATQIDATVPATANAEALIEGRGFWTRFFFGGDAVAANTILQATNQNQARVQALMQLLGSASTTPAVRTELETQLRTMQQEQDRLMQVAQTELHRWGIFSWRF